MNGIEFCPYKAVLACNGERHLGGSVVLLWVVRGMSLLSHLSEGERKAKVSS